ncbi:MAG: hypothetical protein WC242_03920 [Candidatus Paceibacterota bacterium]|jgi:hypothetical protein
MFFETLFIVVIAIILKYWSRNGKSIPKDTNDEGIHSFTICPMQGEEVRQWIRMRLAENVNDITQYKSLDYLARTQWSPEFESLMKRYLWYLNDKSSTIGEFYWSTDFERLMRIYLIIGGLRYGLLGAPGKPQYKRMKEIFRRIDRYRETGNTGLLVDIANSGLLEFVEGDHQLQHIGDFSVDLEDTDRLNEICRLVSEYNISGNLSLLGAIAVLAMIEFSKGEHQNRHLEADDDKYHYDLRLTS